MNYKYKLNALYYFTLGFCVVCASFSLYWSINNKIDYDRYAKNLANKSKFLEIFIFEDVPSFVSNLVRAQKTISSLRAENKNLKTQIANLSSINLTLKNIEQDNKKLSSILKIKNNNNIKKIITTNIIFGKMLTQQFFKDNFTIPVGTNEGIGEKTLVVSTNGVVGYIIQSNYENSIVKTTFDDKFKIAAKTANKEYNIILSGNGSNLLDINTYNGKIYVKEGEEIYTSGLEGNFPKNILIGTIVKSSKDKEWKVLLSENLSNISYVFLVK